jgi:hypothetical protein
VVCVLYVVCVLSSCGCPERVVVVVGVDCV